MRYLIGIGTFMAQDDSVGLQIAEHIAESGLDEGFDAIVLAGSLIDILGYLDGSERVLIVDSAHMGKQPGAWRIFKYDEVEDEKQLPGASTHEGDLIPILRFAASVGLSADNVAIMGIEPETADPGEGLSDTVAARFDEYVEAALAYMKTDDAE